MPPCTKFTRYKAARPSDFFTCHLLLSMPGSNKTRALIDPLAKTRLLVMSPRSVAMLPSLNTLRMSCHRGRSQCCHRWILFVCHVTEVGRNATIPYILMSPRSVVMLPSLNTLPMSCHRGRSQCYHPYILFVCHVTEVGRNDTILTSYVMSPRSVTMLPSFHPNQGLRCQVNVRLGKQVARLATPYYHF